MKYIFVFVISVSLLTLWPKTTCNTVILMALIDLFSIHFIMLSYLLTIPAPVISLCFIDRYLKIDDSVLYIH